MPNTTPNLSLILSPYNDDEHLYYNDNMQTLDSLGAVIQGEIYGASPSASASTNVTALQDAFNAAQTAGGGTVTLMTPGVFNLNSTIVLPKGGNVRFFLGKNTTLKRANNQNTPMLQSFNYNAYATTLSSYFVGPQVLTGDLTSTASKQVRVAWNNHPFTPNVNYVLIGGTTNPTAYNGVFMVVTPEWTLNTSLQLGYEIVVNGFIQRVTTAGTSGATEPTFNSTPSGTTTDHTITWTNEGAFNSTNNFYYNTDRVPSSNPTGTITGMTVDSNIEIIGGIWDVNTSNQTMGLMISGQPANLLYDCMDLGGVQNVYVHDLVIIDAGFYPINIGSARDVLVENANIAGVLDCAAVVGQGPLANARFVNLHGTTTDDSVWVSAGQVAGFDGQWTSGDVNNVLFDGINFYQPGASTGEVVLWVNAKSVGYMGGISIRNVSGSPFFTSVAIGGVAASAYLEDVKIENINSSGWQGNSSSTNGYGVAFIYLTGGSYTLEVGTAVIDYLSAPPSTLGNAIDIYAPSGGQTVTIHQLIVKNVTINDTGFNSGNALCFIGGTVATATFENCFMATGSSSFFVSSNGAINNLVLSNNKISGPGNGIVNLGLTAETNVLTLGNDWSGTYGTVVNNNSIQYVSICDAMDSMSGGVLRTNGSLTADYQFYGTHLTNGSLYQQTGSGSPTLFGITNGAGVVNATRGFSVAGVTGLSSFGPSGISSITIAGGIVTAATASSDERLKNSSPYSDGLEVVSQINPVKFTWNEEGQKQTGIGPDKEFIGFLAQDVQRTIPEAIGVEKSVSSNTQFLSLDDRPIIAALVNAAKELAADNKALKARLLALENEFLKRYIRHQ